MKTRGVSRVPAVESRPGAEYTIISALASSREWVLQILPRSVLLQQIAGAGSLQAIQMALSAIIGFLIVRHLSKEEYAVLNLLNVGSATLSGFASIGVFSIYVPFANKVGSSASHLRATTHAFRRLDFPILTVGVVAGITFCCISATSNGWLTGSFLVGMFCTLIAAVCQYNFRLAEGAYKVVGKPLLPFRITILSEFVRLILVGGVVLLLVPWMPGYSPALISAMIMVASAAGLYMLQREFVTLGDGSEGATIEKRRTYWSLIRPLLFPSYFFHCAQFFRGSLIYLVSGTTVVAEAAALGRLMMLFAMMDKAVELVVIPRLARIEGSARFLRGLALTFSVVLALSGMLTASACLFPHFWLWILGEQYQGLGVALVWAVSAAAVERLSGLILFAQLARGDTSNQWWVPLLSTAAYLTYAWLTKLSTVSDATVALLISAIVGLVAQLGILGVREGKRLAA